MGDTPSTCCPPSGMEIPHTAPWGRQRLGAPPTCPGKGERFGIVLGAKTAVGDTVAGRLLSPPCCLPPGVFTGCGLLGLEKGLGDMEGGAKIHLTTANTPACRVWGGPGAIQVLGGPWSCPDLEQGEAKMLVPTLSPSFGPTSG